MPWVVFIFLVEVSVNLYCISLISDCTMEYDIYYDGNSIAGSYKQNGVPTAEACRTYCESDFDAPFFHWINRGYCTCKSSSAGRVHRTIYGNGGDVSGVARGCGGATSTTTTTTLTNTVATTILTTTMMTTTTSKSTATTTKACSGQLRKSQFH